MIPPINSEKDEKSVNLLMKRLCESIIQGNEKNKTRNDGVVNKLKSKAFEVLLKSEHRDEDENKIQDPHRELDVILFEYAILSKNDPVIKKLYYELKEVADFCSKDPYFQGPTGKNVLRLLLYLRQPVASQMNKPLRLPTPFSFYPQKSSNVMRCVLESSGPFTSSFKSQKQQLPEYSILSENLNENSNIKETLKFPRPSLSHQDIIPSASNWSFKTLSNPIVTIGSLPQSRFFQENSSESDLNNKKQTKTIKKKPLPVVRKPAFKAIDSEDVTVSVLNWNWETLGSNRVKIAPPFASECDSSLNLKAVLNRNKSKSLMAKIVPVKRFISDLKALTVGVQSDCFFCDQYSTVFEIVPDITVPNVLPEVIENFVKEFLECGTCFKRIQLMVENYNYRHKNNGFMYRALCSTISDYLVSFRKFVFSCHAESVLQLYAKMREMMKQLCSLATIFGVHPTGNIIKPPVGSQFLGYLYKEIGHIAEKDLVMLLVYMFRRCSSVYFKHLQKWIYQGVLDDPCNELFISFIDNYRPQTKYFYDKAYFVRKDFVPGFLHGFEDKILQCGKYAQMLKAFKPNHPLFDVGYPQISLYLSFDEIDALEKRCERYSDEVKQVCGEVVTVVDIFNRKIQRKKEFLKMVLEKSSKNTKKWLADKAELRALKANEKKKWCEEMEAQLEENKKRKIEEKKTNLELELKLLKEMQEVEDKRQIAENLELQKRIEYYKELHVLIEQKNKKIDTEIKEADAINPGCSTTGEELPDIENGKLSTGKISEASNINAETPNTETDFESCFGDDDGDRELVQEEPSVLAELIEKVKETGDHETDLLTENNNIEGGRMKKSFSDILNSNETVLKETRAGLSECTRNRNRVLGSNLDFFEDNVTTELKVNINQKLTEAQKIKLKVLTQEYNLTEGQKEDVNSNLVLSSSVSETELSELQKNRKKMMESKPFDNFNKGLDRRNLRLDLNTERARNRQKVLSSEFDLPITASKSTITPMSTTSDTSSVDVKTNNDDKIANLTLDIERAMDSEGEKTAASTAENILTPESALNTAGLLARQGFDFTTRKDPSSEITVVDAPSTETLEEEQEKENEKIQKNTSNDDPYRRCEELIQSNFKCKPKYPMFTLKRMNEVSDDDKKESQKSIKYKNTKPLSVSNVIALTEFIQKSITIPLDTQLKIVNNEIMRIFLEELDILSHFKSLRNYFFLMDGEFGSLICDGLITKLEKGAKPIELFNYQVLHTILENALGSSIIGNDKNSTNLSFIVSDVPDKFDITSPSVLNCLSLSYRVDWPVNLILNPETIQQYGIIFKYLIKVRRISWILEEAHQILKTVVNKNGKDVLLSPQYRRVQQIRHKFYHFVNVLKNHITSTALQASWKTFKDDLLTARTVEDLYRKHTTYIKRIIFLCLLNRKSIEFLNNIENIFKVTIRFVRNLKSREWKCKPGQKFFTHSRYERLLADEVEFEKFIKYTIYLGNKIVRHGYQEEIGEFIGLINFNHYYHES